MIVSNKNVVCVPVSPLENESELVVDADAVTSCKPSLKQFQTIAGWDTEVPQVVSTVQQVKLTQGNCPNWFRNRSSGLGIYSIEQILRSPVFEALDHDSNIHI